MPEVAAGGHNINNLRQIDDTVEINKLELTIANVRYCGWGKQKHGPRLE